MEFVARVKAVLRRCARQSEERELYCKDLRVNVSRHEVSYQGEVKELTRKEFELLEYLMENKGLVMSRNQILCHVWGYDFDGETRTVDVHVRTLRQKLGGSWKSDRDSAWRGIPDRRSCMKKKILHHTSIMIIFAVLVTFLAASVVTYNKLNTYMQRGVREEAQYICLAMDEYGDSFLTKKLQTVSSSRVTLIRKDGTVLYDSEASPKKLANHSDRPEFIQAEKNGKSESIRYSETFAKKTFYYAVKLDDGNVLRVGKTVDSIYSTWISSLAVLGLLMLLVLILEFVFAQRQTRELIRPVNDLDLEHPLNNVCYEELRPLLVRVDEQNRQIRQQVKELKEAEEIRKEFSANVSHELKTPLMSISGYAELMMNGMVPADHMQEFSGRIYHESIRLSNLVADIIQLSRLDESNSEVPFEEVDLYELAEDVRNNLRHPAGKKNIS